MTGVGSLWRCQLLVGKGTLPSLHRALSGSTLGSWLFSPRDESGACGFGAAECRALRPPAGSGLFVVIPGTVPADRWQQLCGEGVLGSTPSSAVEAGPHISAHRCSPGPGFFFHAFIVLCTPKILFTRVLSCTATHEHFHTNAYLHTNMHP